jgi:hypothetical protein
MKIFILVVLFTFTGISAFAEEVLDSDKSTPKQNSPKKEKQAKKSQNIFNLNPKNKGFERMDLNEDGFITVDEMQSKPLEIFAEHDLNKDGTVTKAELTSSVKTRFDLIDTDKDGKLNLDEARGKLHPHAARKLKKENKLKKSSK